MRIPLPGCLNTAETTDAGPRSGVENGVAVNSVVTIQILQIAGLTERIDAKRVNPVSRDRPKPPESARVGVAHGHDRRLRAVVWAQNRLWSPSVR